MAAQEELDESHVRCGSCGRSFSDQAWGRLSLLQTLAPEAIAHHVVRWPSAQRIEVRRCASCGGSMARVRRSRARAPQGAHG